MAKKYTPQDLGFKKKKKEEKKSPALQPAPAKNVKPEVLRDVKGGLSGVVSPSGQFLMGMKPDEVRRYLGKEETRTGEPQEILEFGAQKTQQNIELLKKEQAETPLPRTRELKPQKFELESKDPLDQFIARTNLGEAIAARAALKQRDIKKIVEQTDYMNEMGLSPKQVTDDPVTQTLLKMQFNEIDLQVLESGEAKVSAFSQAIESLPIPAKWRIEITKTPTGKINTISKELKDIESDSTKWIRAANRSPHLREQFADLIAESEDRVAYLESTLKLLIMQSPYLQANPEEINLIMSEIDGYKTNLRERKLAAQDPLLLAQYIEFEGMLG